MESPRPSFNTRAVLSLLFAVLTVLSFCVGVAPIPLTSLICYPAALLLGGIALWTGWSSLREVRQNGGRGRRLALVGMWTGGLTLLAVLCFSAVAIVLAPTVFDLLHQAWIQLQP